MVTRWAQQRPAVDLPERAVHLWRCVEPVHEQIGEGGVQRLHLDVHRVGDERTRGGHGEVVQIEDETMGIVVHRRDILDDHRWQTSVGIARNDELDGMRRGVGAHGQLVSSPIENGERHRSREIVVDPERRRVGRCQWLHDRLLK